MTQSLFQPVPTEMLAAKVELRDRLVTRLERQAVRALALRKRRQYHPSPGVNLVGIGIGEKIVDDRWSWRHSDADGENAPSHVRGSLIGPEVLVPLRDGELALGTYQGIFFCEFDGPRDRKVYLATLA